MVEGKKSVFLRASSIEALEARIAPATFKVTTAADSGPGSLRQAMLDANATAEADGIFLDSLGDSIIYALSPLPTVTAPLSIVGLQATIDGSLAGEDANGLTNESVLYVTGIHVRNFAQYGILSTAGDLTVRGTGINRSGLDGIRVNGGAGNLINVTSTMNGRAGVAFDHATSAGLVSVAGYSVISSNGSYGVVIDHVANTVLGSSQERNSDNVFVTDNGSSGLLVIDSSNVTVAQFSLSGNGYSAPVGDFTGGIQVRRSQNVSIGGEKYIPHQAYAKVGSFVDGNYGVGLTVSESSHVSLFGNTFSHSAEGDGVRVEKSDDLRFTAENKFIENEGWGVSVESSRNLSFHGQTIRGNASGGMLFADSVAVTLGRESSYFNGYNNVYTGPNSIDSGTKSGIVVKGASSVNISKNIFTTSGLPMDLGGDGRTINDPGDADSGPNSLLNYPELEYRAFANSELSQLTGSVRLSSPSDTQNVTIVFYGALDPETSQRAVLKALNTTLVAGGAVFSVSGLETKPELIEVHYAINTGNIISVIDPSNYTFTPAKNPSQTTAVLNTAVPGATFRVQVYQYDASDVTYVGLSHQDVITDENGHATVSFTGLTGPNLFATVTNRATGETSEFSLVASVNPSLDLAGATIMEGDAGIKNVALKVTLATPVSGEVRVSYGTRNGTAVAGEDYGAVAGTLVFAPGETEKTFVVSVVGDTMKEALESFSVQLSEATGASISNGYAEVVIVNDDGIPKIQIENGIVLEGSNPSILHSGYTEHRYQVSLSGPSVDPVTVRLRSVDGTATVNEDFVAVDEILTFAPGVTSVFKTVYVKNDSVAEFNESIGFQLSDPSAGVIDKGSALLTIADDDGWVVVADSNLAIEGGSGESPNVAIDVRLSNILGLTDHLAPIQLAFATKDGSAVAGADFISQKGVLTFAPGELSKTIAIQIVGDQIPENSESFGIECENVVGAKTPSQLGTVEIWDDDPFAVISKNGKQATWIDVDGDRVKLTVNQPVLSNFSFVLGSIEGGATQVKALILHSIGDMYPISVEFKATKGKFGNGRVDLERIDAANQDLRWVKVDGNLGSILAGDWNVNTPGIGHLVVDSFGEVSVGVEAAPLESVVKGELGSLQVKHDVTGVMLEVQGRALQSLRVGGDWLASCLAVGASAGADGAFGTADDVLDGGIVSKIGRITVVGRIAGTTAAENATDHFGFVAGKIAVFQAGHRRLPLSGQKFDMIELGRTSDVTLREVSAAS